MVVLRIGQLSIQLHPVDRSFSFLVRSFWGQLFSRGSPRLLRVSFLNPLVNLRPQPLRLLQNFLLPAFSFLIGLDVG